jgi:membrane fusion protein (multidrug efflux system)
MTETDASRSLLRSVLLWGVPVAALIVGLAVWAFGGRYIETDNAYVKADIVPIHPEIEAQVTEVPVAENTRVEAGQVLVKLDPESAEIDVRRAEARLIAVREEIVAARRQLEQRLDERSLAAEQIRYADRELARQRELVAAKMVPTSRFDAAEHEALQARGKLQVVEQGIAELRVRLGPALDGNAAAHPRVAEAKADLEAVRLRLRRAVITAPEGGRVVKVPRRGEMARRGASLLTLVRSDDLWIEANFKETQLGLLRAGQRVNITIDSYPGALWRGHVDTISPASGAEFAVLPPQNASGNWVKVVQRIAVRIAIDTGPAELPLRAGTSAVVEVDPQSGNRLSRFLGRH